MSETFQILTTVSLFIGICTFIGILTSVGLRRIDILGLILGCVFTVPAILFLGTLAGGYWVLDNVLFNSKFWDWLTRPL